MNPRPAARTRLPSSGAFESLVASIGRANEYFSATNPAIIRQGQGAIGTKGKSCKAAPHINDHPATNKIIPMQAVAQGSD
jgi:hypothetical protein